MKINQRKEKGKEGKSKEGKDMGKEGNLKKEKKEIR